MGLSEILIWIVIGLAFAILAFAIYVRLAPIQADRWQNAEIPTLAPGVYPSIGGHAVVAVVPDAQAALMALDGIVRATPRTRLVAGSVADGRVTYVTRSALWGFPDYTSVQAVSGPDGQAAIHVQGHLRFGQSDLGVNRKRIEGWLAALDAGG